LVKKDKSKGNDSFSISIDDMQKQFDKANDTLNLPQVVEPVTKKELDDTMLATKNVAEVIRAIVGSLAVNTELHAAIATLVKNLTTAFIKEGYSDTDATHLALETIKTLQPLFKVY
jgi:hypothetical protein